MAADIMVAMVGLPASLALLFSALAAPIPAQELRPDVLLLARIKLRAKENLSRLPNYTCLETIERSQRPASSRRYRLVDVVRLEVALVENKEMFAWPGSANFDQTDIRDMVSGGAIGNGSFALHARSVFLSNVPSFEFVGDWALPDGRNTIRFDYRVPMNRSGYRLRVPPVEGIVGYEGSFFVHPQTLDLERLVVKITEIPPELPVASGQETLDYQRVRIGEGDFLLPRRSEMILTNLDGSESHNRTSFNNCRQFAGESVLSFDDVPIAEKEAPKPPQRIVLPEGLTIELKLSDGIEIGKTAVGDPMRAVVIRDVKRKGVVWIPKGAQVTGRLARLERHQHPRAGVFWAAGLRFEKVEFDGRFADFRATLRNAFAGMQNSTSFPPRLWQQQPPDDPRVGILYMRGEEGRLAPGALMLWRTEAPIEEDIP